MGEGDSEEIDRAPRGQRESGDVKECIRQIKDMAPMG